MKHRRFLIPAAIALTAALLLTACGQPAGNTNPSPARTHTVATPPPDDPESLPEDSTSSGSDGARHRLPRSVPGLHRREYRRC